MLFATRRALTLPCLLLLTTSGCAGFVDTTRIAATPNACASLLPDSWRTPVPGATLPALLADVGAWMTFGAAQTGQLDKANGRTADAIGIVERCEKRDAEAISAAKPKILGIF